MRFSLTQGPLLHKSDETHKLVLPVSRTAHKEDCVLAWHVTAEVLKPSRKLDSSTSAPSMKMSDAAPSATQPSGAVVVPTPMAATYWLCSLLRSWTALTS